MQNLEKIRDVLCRELENIDTNNITVGKLDIINKITHSIKSIDTIMAMDSGQSNRSYSMNREPGYSNGGYSNGGYSYRRNRDSMGRYSRADENEDLRMHLEDMLNSVSGDKRHMVQGWINQL